MTLHDLSKVGSAEAVDAFLSTVSSESPDDLQYVLDLRNEQRYTALHCAIFSRFNLNQVSVLFTTFTTS